MEKAKPDLFIFMGDNVYPAGFRPADIRLAYAKLRTNEGFRSMHDNVPHMAIWDDHDYGLENGGLEFQFKQHFQWEFKNFFHLFEDKAAAARDGVYSSAVFGPPGREVQVILLDTRYFRSPLNKDRKTRAIRANTDKEATLLGVKQWQWLEEQLKIPAAIRIIGSGIQVLPRDQDFEKWNNFPRERDKLLGLLRDNNIPGVILISGDRHFAELSFVTGAVPYPLYEITASPLDASIYKKGAWEKNRHRVQAYANGFNFGVIKIDWTAVDPLISLQVRDTRGDVRIKKEIPLSQLQ